MSIDKEKKAGGGPRSFSPPNEISTELEIKNK